MLMLVLIACFAGQSFLVYLDPLPTESLSSEAAQGRRIWHSRNCQSCHQFYGFGGFLGPDLTNGASRFGPQRLERLLTEGSGVMPAFDLSHDEAAAVYEFLKAMDTTGQGQAKVELDEAQMKSFSRRLFAAIREEAAQLDDPQVTAGLNLFAMRGCRECHFPVSGSLAGAADLLSVPAHLSRDQIMLVLKHGQPPLMPETGFSHEEREHMYAFIVWLGRNHFSLVERVLPPPANGSGRWSNVPWWEFR